MLERGLLDFSEKFGSMHGTMDLWWTGVMLFILTTAILFPFIGGDTGFRIWKWAQWVGLGPFAVLAAASAIVSMWVPH